MKCFRQRIFLLLTCGFVLAGFLSVVGCGQNRDVSEPAVDEPTTQSADSPGEADVPFVRTPQEVVGRMLELAEVSEDDVVYDLGSGDGRFVITAAERYDARGVGIEIDPERVRTARKNAKEAGVADQVEFRQQDLFEADFSEATVVTLYLLTSVNRKLRPELFKQLDPGDRVVSHDFDMGAWEPDTTVEEGRSTIYLWTIPETVPETLK